MIKPINIVEQALSLYFFTTLNISGEMMLKIRNNSETIYQNKEKIDINKEDECQKYKGNCIKYTALKEKIS